MSRLKQLANPLIALAKKNSPNQFMRDELVDMALFSEVGISEYIAGGLGGLLLWCEPNGWLVYDESTGTFVNDHAEDVIYEIIKVYRDTILSLIGKTEPQNQNSAFGFYKALLNASTTKAIINLLKHEPGVTALPTDFNRDMDVVNCSGTVVAVDGSTRPATPEDRFTFSAACKPEPGIPETFMDFIRWSSSGNEDLVRWKLTAYGVALFGHPTDRIINHHGKTGRNGKGAELRTAYRIAGSYATVLPRPLVIKEPYSLSRFDREILVGKRMAVLFDLKVEKGKLNLDDLKTICGNGDPQSVEPKGKPRYNAVISCKVFIASNEKIPVDSFGASEKDRFYLVPFDNYIRDKDETLEDRFKPEYGKILNLFIEHAVEYFQKGRKMPTCAAIDQATANYFDSQDLVGQFIQDDCEIGKEYCMPKTELYNNFVAWCGSEQAISRPMKSKTFTEALERREIYETVKKISGKATRVFVGIVTRLRKSQEFDLLAHEKQKKFTNREIELSCNRVTFTPKNDHENVKQEQELAIW